jgi:CRISPR-associated protein Cas8a1/Csx13
MASKLKPAGPKGLTIELSAPGMTPLLRAGLGGLAASLHAIASAEPSSSQWPERIAIGSGHARVSYDRVFIEWGEAAPDEVIDTLLTRSFKLREPEGFILLPGTVDRSSEPSLALLNEMQKALRKTFLQHGSSAKKRASRATFTVSVDDREVTVQGDGYVTYNHREALEDILKALSSGRVQLAGWAYPGAAQRHEKWRNETAFAYDAGQALAASFALVGCVSYLTPLTLGGVLVIPEPSDLVGFAVARPLMSPTGAADVSVSSTGEASLRAHLALRLAGLGRRSVIASTHAVGLRTMPWAKQQKSRVHTQSVDAISDEALDLFDQVMRGLPSKIRVPASRDAATKAKKNAKAKKPPVVVSAEGTSDSDGDSDASDGYFVALSALRGFLSDNIAAGRPWFEGFATATVGVKQPRFVHYYRDKDNLGALYPEERKGLVMMLDKLDEAQTALVRSVHVALRQRYGMIADETRDNPAAMKNRFKGERERLRLAFAGAKTHEQVRAALADLWSRAGSNRELKQHWEKVLVLLGPAHWQSARDLALVALASYEGSSDDDGNQKEKSEKTS